MKRLFFVSYIFLFFSFSFADDFDFSSFSSDFTQEENDTSQKDSSSSSFGDFSSSDAASTSSPLSFSGKAEAWGRCYVEEPDTDAKDSTVKTNVLFDLTANYIASSSELSATVRFDKDTIEDYPEDIVQELVARLFLGDFVIEAGKMKVVWGKGDKLHVLDNFNADDYRNFLLPDYIDRRLAEPMLRIAYNAPCGLRLEGIYTPLMTQNRYAKEGLWKPQKVSVSESLAKSVLANNLDAALISGYFSGETLIQASSFSSDDVFPDTQKLKYWQGGLRLLGTVGSFDLGASYYYGHYKDVSCDLEDYIQSGIATGGTPLLLPKLSYDRKQTFGLEAATVLGPLNLRAEGAYNLTDDRKGSDPWVHNNSVAWLFGFDIDLPIHNMNFNIQEMGTCILKYDNIHDAPLYEPYDVDYDTDDYCTNNKLVVDLKDTFLHEKLELEAKGLWGIERGDIVVMPSVAYNIRDGLEFNLKGLFIHSDEEKGEFSGWGRNSFVQVGAIYKF